MKSITFYFFILSFVYNVGFSQNKDHSNEQLIQDSVYLIKMTDGSLFYGKILWSNEKEIRLLTNNAGEITIQKSKIDKLELQHGIKTKSGEYWFKNPTSTRYLISPSAFNLKAGEGYYQNIWVLFHSAHIGIADFFSLGAGFETLTLLRGQPIFFLVPKFSFRLSDNFYAGIGGLYLNMAKSTTEFGNGLGLGYGLITYGTRDDNITFGAGFDVIDGKFRTNPSFTLSGMLRLSKHIGLVSENWFFSDMDNRYYFLVSYGMRFIWESVTIDLAFINNNEIINTFFLGVPFLDFVIKF
ncbi:MAG: hypothetical protein QXG00_07980 [Candidatus Woesearchaeota archaeon]